MKTLFAMFLTAVGMIGCVSSPSGSSPPTSTSSSASASPFPPPMTLTLRAQVVEWCGSIGGCVYYALLDGPSGTRRLDFQYTGPDGKILEFGPSEQLAPGSYQLTYTSQLMSDVVANEVRGIGPVDATCRADFVVASTSGALISDGSFDSEACTVTVSEV